MIPVAGKDRAYDADELARIAVGEGLDAHAEQGLIQALEASRARADGPVRILICGSLYLAGQVLELLEKKNTN
jgi:dihydrofolate synthase/folylpolyglutamate synthase